MRTKQSRSVIITGRYRLSMSCCIAEESINLTHGVRFGWFWRHYAFRICPALGRGTTLIFMTQ
jgi:hypothetical protein